LSAKNPRRIERRISRRDQIKSTVERRCVGMGEGTAAEVIDGARKVLAPDSGCPHTMFGDRAGGYVCRLCDLSVA